MNKEILEPEKKGAVITEDDFGCMLHQLELLNESFPYYKTMLKRD